MMGLVIKAEGMKIRGICWGLPVIQAVILLGMTAMQWYLQFRQGPGGVFAGFAVMFMFLSFVVLLGNTLLASIFAGVEHDTQSWKQMMTIPVPRHHFFAAKLFWVLTLQIMMIVLTITGTILIWLLYTNEPIPWGIMIMQPINAVLASVPILVIQLWLSVQFPNQSFPLAIGILGSIASLFLARSSVVWMHWLPWSYPVRSSPLVPGYMTWVVAGLCVGALLALLGCIQFSRKQIN